MTATFRYHHVGIPTNVPVPGEEHVPHLKIFATDHRSNSFGIQWMRYEEGCPVPELVRTVPHVAFEVDDLDEALRGLKVLIAPNSPAPGVLVAMVEEQGAPVELMQFTEPSARRERGAAEGRNP